MTSSIHIEDKFAGSTGEFTLLMFQERLAATLRKCWDSPTVRQQLAGQLHLAKAEKTLRAMGYANEDVWTILIEAKDMAKQLRFMCYSPVPSCGPEAGPLATGERPHTTQGDRSMDAEEILNLLADDRFISLTNGPYWVIRYVVREVEGSMKDKTLDKLLERFREFLDTEAICSSGK